jgi:hypothetical protein
MSSTCIEDLVDLEEQDLRGLTSTNKRLRAGPNQGLARYTIDTPCKQIVTFSALGNRDFDLSTPVLSSLPCV